VSPHVPTERGWCLLPYVVLRMAGFPFDWLSGLADAPAAVAGGDLVRRSREVDDLAAKAAHTVRDIPVGQPGGRESKRLLRVMRRGLPPTEQCLTDAEAPVGTEVADLFQRYREAFVQETTARESFHAAYENATDVATRRVVGRFRTETLLRDVLLVANDDAYPVLTAWLDLHRDPHTMLSADRSKVDTLVRYLQRVCAKNDTHSHFGPFTPGAFADHDEGVRWRTGDLERHPVFSRWAAESLLETAGVSLVTPRRAPGAAVSGGMLRVVDFDYMRRRVPLREIARPRPPVPISVADAALFRLCDGASTVPRLRRLLSEAGHPYTEPELLTRLDALADLGAVVLGPELPVGVEDSLAVLREQFESALPESWRRVLTRIQATVAGLAGGTTPVRAAAVESLNTLFTDATATAPRRNHGLFYGDRNVYYEECLSWCRDFTVGRPVVDTLRRDLAPVYDLFLLRPRVRLTGERQIVGEWLAARFGTGSTVGALDYLRAYLEDQDSLRPRYEELENTVAAAGARADALLLSAGHPVRGGHGHRLDESALVAALQELSPPVPALCNPDVLLVAPSTVHLRRGEFTAIVGDLHAVEEVISHQMFAPFMERRFPDYPETVVRAYQALLEPDEEVADVVQMHRNKAYIQALLPCRDVEAFGRSAKDRAEVLPLGDLIVVASPDGPRLGAPGSNRFLRLMALPFGQLGVRPNPFAVFGFPRHMGGLALDALGHHHVPRLEVGRVVVQRELWRVPVEQLTSRDHRVAFARIQGLREQLALPRHLYARLPTELKPIYCDLDAPLLVRQLSRMAAESTGVVELTEMLPGPGDLWLDRGGERFTTEIRFTAYTRGGRCG
jgi:hypothetical protein